MPRRKTINLISPCDRRAPKRTHMGFFYAHGDAEDVIKRRCSGPDCNRCDPDFVIPADTGSFEKTIRQHRLGPGEHPVKLYGRKAFLVLDVIGDRGLVVLANNKQDLAVARRQLRQHRRRWSKNRPARGAR